MIARKASMSEKAVSTVTPSATTSAGSCGVTCDTRFCTRTSAISGSVPVAKVTVSLYSPLLLELEFI